MLTKLYLDTTNPKLSCNMVSFIFFGKNLSKNINIRLILC
jgi:hypothetical protein